ncbi:kinase-like domain-containing protein [Rhizophagus diaphanus]|nr:kinase-like domain-containing protein [Rhizophagus diaphanus] [Rhizophagus sp. MUCL 43196]
MSYNNKTEIHIGSEFNELNISDKDSDIDHENCYKPESSPYTLWCEECAPNCIIEGWSSGNNDVDEFIKNTIYDARKDYHDGNDFYPLFLEWVPFDRFEDIKQIGEGGFAKVYSAIWIDGKAKYFKQNNGNWKKREPEPIKVALKKLNESYIISADYSNEIKTLWNVYVNDETYLKFYGITKNPETKEFIMIIELANQGNLRSVLSSDFNKLLWKDKLRFLVGISLDLKKLHQLGCFHKDLHSGNILQNCNEYGKRSVSYVSDFGLSGPSNKKKSDDKIYGVLPYIAPESLNRKPYTLSSDVYSFGVIMTELSSGIPPFYERKHDDILALAICNGIRPEFGKGTPEIYKKLAYRCMNANPDQRPTARELYDVLKFWCDSCEDNIYSQEKCGYKGKEIRNIFNEINKEILNISTSYEKNPDAIYTSRIFTFSNLPKPINSSIITSYLNEEDNKDSQDS